MRNSLSKKRSRPEFLTACFGVVAPGLGYVAGTAFEGAAGKGAAPIAFTAMTAFVWGCIAAWESCRRR